MKSRGTRMRAVDRSWLRMESAENPMMISSVLVFEEPIDIAQLKQILNDRFLRFRQFTQRAIQHNDSAEWRDDPLFDLDNHFHVLSLPGNATQTDLQNMVSDLNSTPLHSGRPLWQIHYIDNYDGGCALVIRIHHCIADGISLVRVLLSLTDRSPDAKAPKLQKAPAIKFTPRGLLGRYINRAVKYGQASVYQLRLFGDAVIKQPSYPLKLTNTASKIAMECARLGFARSEPNTGLKKALTGRKKVAWAEPPLSLAEVKLCARALGGTTNDVLMAVATGALRRHFNATKERIPQRGLRVAVPFNLRSLRQPLESLGNEFGLVLVTLPVEVESPLARFRQVQKHMNRLKESYQAQITYSLLDIFGRGPDVLERRAIALISSKASAVLTNVPGPKKPVYLAGVKLKQPMFWVPQTGDIGIGMSIFSYAGTVQFGLTVDRGINADPVAIMSYFRESFEELRDHALQRSEDEPAE
ncbi:MAG: wax ester/triacylglycerol synthase family O-acyltransferase [Oleiphilaceae bacterium]|nr:wax ester/triacylglycerol synthase family O-acyltransferase [Oleiphilaceae bacterium]